MDRAYDLENSILNFVAAFSILMHYTAFPDLQDREDLLCDAIAAIDKTIPTSTSAGTTLGALFPSWPRAAKLLASARLHCTQLANSRKALEAFTASLARAMVLIKKLDHTVLTRAPSHSADALKALHGAQHQFHEGLAGVPCRVCTDFEFSLCGRACESVVVVLAPGLGGDIESHLQQGLG